MLSSLLLALPLAALRPAVDGPHWFEDPTVSGKRICFALGGDLWDVPREGGDARRLTASVGQEGVPSYSPDGNWIAFSGQYAGKTDVYVMPAEGGVPKQLTFGPAEDEVLGWSPDGKSVLFATTEGGMPFTPRLYTVPAAGGQPEGLPFPQGTMGSFSPDGKQIAYVPYGQFQKAWKRYRGGQAFPIWISKLEDSSWKEVPRRNWNDKAPMWVGNRIYYLSDRTGKFNLYSCDTSGGSQREHVKSAVFGFTSATAGADAIALCEPGSISLFDLKSGKASPVSITVRGDFPEVRAKYVPISQGIAGADVSPTGKRVAFESRGEIVTVPASKGDARNLSNSSSSAERSPAWSPDGKSIAYFSDAGGEYKIVVRLSDGSGDSKTIEPGGGKGFYQGLAFSPDSKKLSYSDNRGALWVTEVESGKATKVDEAPLYPVTYGYSPSWSPDSKWLAFSRIIDNYQQAAFVYSLESSKLTQITDGMSEAFSPAFDRNGKYLYFLASTNAKSAPGWLDLTALETPNQTYSVYMALLQKELPSPFLPESDEEPVAEAKKPEKKDEPFRIDLEGLNRRVLSVPMPSRVYRALVAGTEGTFFTIDTPPQPNAAQPGGPPTIRKYEFSSKKESVFFTGANGFVISPTGGHMMILGPAGPQLVSTAAPATPGQGALDVSAQVIKVDPRAEWRQIFHEAVRLQRDYFYDPGHHGVDLVALEKRYEPFLAGLMSRADLNSLFEDMMGEICVGHMYIGGGDIPGTSGPAVGLLGADFSQENGRYRFSKVYTGESWNPGLRGPLAHPGVNVEAGEYLLGVGGKELKAGEDLYQLFEGKVGKQVRIKVGPKPDGTDSREVTVVPTGNETQLRVFDWVEGNRRKVEELSGGRLGYVWFPNTTVQGYTFFNRYYYAQVNKEGMVLDERYNGGGSVDDYFINNITRPHMSWWMTRYGKDFSSPLMTVYGPKALIINQYAGSGGDYFPWAFRKAKLGPLVGKRTWGGLVGILGFPAFVDGGSMTSPNLAFYSPDGEWEIENFGTAPDIEVEWDPVLWRQGRDAQLEKAVAEVMNQLKSYKKPTPKRPPFKDNTKIGGG
ncbi:MAG: PD40 domain-containing protein [Armatimonadetes bacterium]|nr:PD40 domain-containing protein [Armatimonadota bacterium]